MPYLYPETVCRYRLMPQHQVRHPLGRAVQHRRLNGLTNFGIGNFNAAKDDKALAVISKGVNIKTVTDSYHCCSSFVVAVNKFG